MASTGHPTHMEIVRNEINKLPENYEFTSHEILASLKKRYTCHPDAPAISQYIKRFNLAQPVGTKQYLCQGGTSTGTIKVWRRY